MVDLNVPIGTESVKTTLELKYFILNRAAEAYEREMESLDTLNKTKAMREIAELFEISVHDLWLFVEYGEEEHERLFNMKYGNPDEIMVTSSSDGVRKENENEKLGNLIF